MHPDHRAAARLVRRALSGAPPLPARPDVLMYEVWTPLQRMDEIVDISPFVEIKLAAVRAHRSQCDVLRFDEAVRGLNRYRGEMHSWPGGDYAEVFARMRL
jgi:LmbE family N-acetylglucosaminyl deacetylase